MLKPNFQLDLGQWQFNFLCQFFGFVVLSLVVVGGDWK